jgi:2-dehydro-3-deoxygluconokinase
VSFSVLRKEEKIERGRPVNGIRSSLDAVVIGDANVDVILQVPEHPSASGIAGSSAAVRGHQLYVGSGGAAANTAMALAKLERRVGFVGVVGNDLFGNLIRQKQSDAGIDLSHLGVVNGATTGVVFRFEASDGRAVIYSSPGPPALDALLLNSDYISAARVLYISGNILTQTRAIGAAVRDLARTARRNGLAVVLDPGRFWLDLSLASYIEDLVVTAQVLLPNLYEAQLLTGEQESESIIQKFINKGAQWVVVKRGDAGCVAASSAESFYFDAYPVTVVSPFGAGDAFNAGVIHGLLKEWPLRETVKFATALAGLKVRQRGTQEGLPSEAEVLAFLSRQGESSRGAT